MRLPLKSFFLFFSLVFSFSAYAQFKDSYLQKDSLITEDTSLLVRLEQMPELEGGVHAFLAKNLRYPLAASENCLQGRVLTRFVVKKDGTLGDVSTVFSVDPVLDKEAKRVIKLMSGKWKPGILNGEPVDVFFTLPITFIIPPTERCRTGEWYYNAALKLYEENNLERAYRFFGQAFKMDCLNFEAGYNYAAVAVSLGKQEEACGVIRFLLGMKYAPAGAFMDQYCR